MLCILLNMFSPYLDEFYFFTCIHMIVFFVYAIILNCLLIKIDFIKKIYVLNKVIV